MTKAADPYYNRKPVPGMAISNGYPASIDLQFQPSLPKMSDTQG